MKRITFAFGILIVILSFRPAPENAPLKLALLKYGGGGDWYANPTALTNLAVFCNKTIGTKLDRDYATVEVGSADTFNYPSLHMTGHGDVVFNGAAADNRRKDRIAGGFLDIDDNYGMDPFVRPALKKVFPELELVEIPRNHPIFQKPFPFPNGLPKVHKHDDLPSKAFGLIYEGKLVCFYTYESDLGDGWEDQEVHKDPPQVRQKALRMGANIVAYAFTDFVN
jgi:hypothetical protein